MRYNIDFIKKDTSIKGVFFFDSNIWIDIIAPSFSENKHKEKYISFFEKVCKNKSSKIAICSVLISEIINVYLKRIALKIYEQENNTTVHYNEYKTKYRITQHFKDQYQIVCDEIDARSESFQYANDPIKNLDLLTASENSKLDFNDFIYYKICQENDFIMVTHDTDFDMKDISILTLNDRLYKQQF